MGAKGETLQLRRVRTACQDVLDANWRTGERNGVPYAYTCPSTGRYPWQWYWDEWKIAIAMRHLYPERAKMGLESLLNAAEPDGFIGHTIFWGSPVTLARLSFYNVRSRNDLMTRTIQPPGLPWAWKIAVGDPKLDPRLGRHLQWFADNRDLEGDGLIWIIQPDESGLDCSPEFDPVWGYEAGCSPVFPKLVAKNRRHDFNAKAIAAAGLPVACEPLTNTIYGLSRLAMGLPSITPQLVQRLWDEKAGVFKIDARPRPKGRIPLTCAALAPLALPDLPEAIGRRLVEEHLLNAKEFWTPVPVPSVAINDPAFTGHDKLGPMRRYWRGDSWYDVSWMIWLGLLRLGYDKEAKQLEETLARTFLRFGSREYYDPFTGTGKGAMQFSWTTLILDMLLHDPRARTSYLELSS